MNHNWKLERISQNQNEMKLFLTALFLWGSAVVHWARMGYSAWHLEEEEKQHYAHIETLFIVFWAFFGEFTSQIF